MKTPSVALLLSMISLVGCAGPVELLFENRIVVDHLDGNYQRLASCTYEHLARQQGQLSIERPIACIPGPRPSRDPGSMII